MAWKRFLSGHALHLQLLSTLLLLCASCWAAAAPPLLELSADQEPIRTRGHVHYWVDTHRDQPTDVTQLPRERFTALGTQGMPAFEKRVWLWLRLHNGSSENATLVLDFGEILLDRAELFMAGSEPPSVARAGLQVPASQWSLRHSFIALPLEIAAGATEDVFIALEASQLALLDPQLMSMHEFAQQSRSFRGVVLGLLIGIFVTVASVASRHRENRTFIDFLLIAALAILLDMILNGSLQRAWPATLPWHLLLFTACLFGLGLAATQFTRRLFDTPATHPPLDRLLRLVMLAHCLLAGIFLLTQSAWVSRCLLAASLGITMILAATGAWYWHRGNPTGRLFTLGMLAFSVLATLPTLGASGIIPYPAALRHTFELAMLGLATLFAVSLAHYIQALRESHQNRLQQALLTERHNRTKSDFLARMSHEIRTPIHGVLGMAQLLQQSELSVGQRRHLGVILSSGRLLLDLVNDLLDYAKIESGRMTLEHIPFELDDLLTQSIVIFLPEAHARKLLMAIDISPHMPLSLLGDPMRLQQILNNLIGNAIKFTDSGEVRITMEHGETGTADRVELRIHVADSGVGIPRELRERLFQPFVQASAATARQHGGTGLGLSISRQLAQLMDGDIELESEPGQGAHFTLRVQCDIDTARERRRRSGRSHLAGRRLLMIYDHPGYGRAMEAHFIDWNMQVCYAERLEDALSHPDAGQAELVFLSSGIALHESSVPARLQALHKPVIVLQSIFDPPVHALFAQTDVHYLDSPCTLTDIQDAFCKALGIDTGDAAVAQHSEGAAADQVLRRVLVAEDNPVNRQVLGAMLKRLAVEALYAHNGVEALARYREMGPDCDLILMDCDMPEMNGYQATEAIRTHEQTLGLPPVPIIAVTAHALADIHQRCQSSGMNHVLTKPLSLKDLANTLQRFSRHAPLRQHRESLNRGL